MTSKEAYNYLLGLLELEDDIRWPLVKESINKFKELIDLQEKIKKDVEFLNSQDIQIFILPDGKEILGYNITDCPSRIVLAESIRENIENILICLVRSDEDGNGN